jgi:hypothetical protein
MNKFPIIFHITCLTPVVHYLSLSNRKLHIDFMEPSFCCRNSSVGVATGYGLEDRGSIPGRGKRFFSTAKRPDPLWGHSASSPMGTGNRFPGGKAAGA